jgi:hypothetical protein
MSKCFLQSKTTVAYGGLYTSWNKKKTSNITDRPPVFILRHHFCKTSMRLRERLKLAFNSCARYIYSISRFRHISPFANRILGVPLNTYYCFRMCCAMYRLVRSGCPGYLFDVLQFGQSSRLFNLITPVHRTASWASSFFVQGSVLWNSLPSIVRREVRVGRFREECLSSLRRSGSEGNV